MEANEGKNTKDGSGGSNADFPEWPIFTAYNVAVIQAQAGPVGRPLSLAVVLDFEEIPGLAEAAERQQAGEVFDTVTQWGISHPPWIDSPIALLALHLPKLDLCFNVAIDVDKHSKALMMVAQTRHVTIVDLETARSLSVKNPFDAMENGRSLGFRVEDAQPILHILLQRLDLPPKAQAADTTDTDANEAEEDVAEFLDGARSASLTTLVMMVGYPPTIALVDPEVGDLRDRLGSEPAFFDGRWAVKTTDDGPIVRLDCSLDGERVASWFLTAPPQEMLRAAAYGANLVVIVDKPIRDGSNRDVLAQLGKGASIFAPQGARAMLKFVDNAPPTK